MQNVQELTDNTNTKTCRQCGANAGALVLVCPECSEIATVSVFEAELKPDMVPFPEPAPLSALLLNLLKALIIIASLIAYATIHH
jgi:RNA polymerase subunit RPABC4/transcription elongation factor Spt4